MLYKKSIIEDVNSAEKDKASENPEGVFFFLNSYGKWIENSNGRGFMTYESADKEIIEAYAAEETEKL